MSLVDLRHLDEDDGACVFYAGAAAASFNPLTAVAWKSAYWASDPLWTPPSAGGTVTSWRDGGSEGKPLTNAFGGPLYRLTAAGGKPSVEFNAGNFDGLVTANWGAQIASGTDRTFVAVVSLSAITNNRTILANLDNSSPHWIGVNTSKWEVAKVSPTSSVGNADTSLHLLTCVMSGSTSPLQVDGTTVVTGGNNGAAMTGVRVGMKADGTSFISGQVAFIGVLASAITAPDLATLKTGFGTLYGLTIA